MVPAAAPTTVPVVPTTTPELTATPVAPVPVYDEFSSLTVKELAKQLLNLAEKQRLLGPENF